jgi:hypothetical protein
VQFDCPNIGSNDSLIYLEDYRNVCGSLFKLERKTYLPITEKNIGMPTLLSMNNLSPYGRNSYSKGGYKVSQPRTVTGEQRAITT